jgi:hypothetical protein
MAIYIDDLEGGVTVFGNIFYRVPRAFNSNCGGDFKIANNLVVECQVASAQEGQRQPTGAKAATLFAQLNKFPFQDALWQTHYPELARYKDWTVPDEPPAGCLDGPLGNTYETNIVVNFSQPYYWGECECCANGYHHGDLEHRKWASGFCASDSPSACAGASGMPNAAQMFSLAPPWTNSTAHFNITPSNAIMQEVDFVSTDLEHDLNFALKPTSPAFKLGWKVIPEQDIGPSDL